ncbi:MAG: hypothetical protein Q7U04_11015 [Bacteriovorax sp.]|nr:hypothetical protein [Bacteriovorax sp.]
MDNTILKKRLSTFKTDKGVLKNVSDELLMDILCAWESWPGSARDFYTSIGMNWKQMAKLMGKAKKLKREGRFPESEFKEIKINSESGQIMESTPCSGVEIIWNNGKIIRFSQVDLLVDFLKKAA